MLHSSMKSTCELDNSMKKNRLKEIDGLRGVALLGVLLYHARLKNVANGGFLGVDVFFVISGYVITRSIIQRINSNSFSYHTYMKSRIFRLLPALLATLFLFNLVARLLFIKEDRYSSAILSLSALFQVSNVHLWLQAGYFDTEAIEKIFLHTWSLSVEWQFYISWALILRSLPSLNQKNFKKYAALSFTSFMFLLSITELFSKTNRSATFYNTIFRYFEFMFGALPALYKYNAMNYFSLEKHSYLQTFLANCSGSELISGGSFLGIVVLMQFFSESISFPGISALPICLMTIILINWSSGTACGRFLCSSPLQFLGKISYSVYLVHWPLLVVLDYYTIKRASDFFKFIAIGFGVLFGCLLHICIEDPFQRHKNKRCFYILLGLFIMSCLILVSDFPYSATNSLDKNQAKNFETRQERLNNMRFYEARGRGNMICQGNELYKLSFSGFEALFDQFQKCNPKKKQEVVLMGDSHAGDFYFALQNMLPQYTVIQITGGGCHLSIKEKNDLHCGTMYKNYEKLLLHRLERIKAVILVSIWYETKSNTYNGTRLESVVDFFQKNTNSQIYVFGPRPKLDARPLQILSLEKHKNWTSLDNIFQSHMKYNHRGEEIVKHFSRLKGITYISTIDQMCPNRTRNRFFASCTLSDTRSNLYFYGDQGHINRIGAKYILKQVIESSMQYNTTTSFFKNLNAPKTKS